MRPGYLSDYDGIVAFREDPVAAAIRADQTAARHVVDMAHDYQSALARGNASEIAATKASLRQAWETDVRRRGGKPEDFIPNYPNADPVIIQHTFLGEVEKAKKQIQIVKLLTWSLIGLFFYSSVKALTDPNIK